MLNFHVKFIQTRRQNTQNVGIGHLTRKQKSCFNFFQILTKEQKCSIRPHGGVILYTWSMCSACVSRPV